VYYGTLPSDVDRRYAVHEGIQRVQADGSMIYFDQSLGVVSDALCELCGFTFSGRLESVAVAPPVGA
jgi:hypothetical protein